MILPVLTPRFQGASHQISSRPTNMLNRPKKRICPSLSCSSCANIRRHPAGEAKGNRPSMTSTRAIASQIVSPSKIYFLAPAALPPRKTLKNSDEDGSTTITSLLLLKLAL